MEGGPERVKCHSKRSLSRGAAWREGSGFVDSSAASLRMRRMVGDLVLKVGVDIVHLVVAFIRVHMYLLQDDFPLTLITNSWAWLSAVSVLNVTTQLLSLIKVVQM